MIIDSHAHIFPDKIAEKASINIGKFYGIEMSYNGTVDTLLKEGTAAGVDKYLVHSVATTPKQVESINEFIAKQVEMYPDKFIGFMTLHPESTNLKEEFDWALSHGLKGVKLHPDFQEFDIDSDKAKEIYSLANGKCPILMHMGDKTKKYSKAYKLAPMFDEFSELDVIAAHFGGYSEWDEAAECLKDTRAYVDSSSSLFGLSPEKTRELIDIYTPQRVLFGTDYPMWDAAEELDRWSKVQITDEERELIFHKNLENLLKKYE